LIYLIKPAFFQLLNVIFAWIESHDSLVRFSLMRLPAAENTLSLHFLLPFASGRKKVSASALSFVSLVLADDVMADVSWLIDWLGLTEEVVIIEFLGLLWVGE